MILCRIYACWRIDVCLFVRLAYVAGFMCGYLCINCRIIAYCWIYGWLFMYKTVGLLHIDGFMDGCLCIS